MHNDLISKSVLIERLEKCFVNNRIHKNDLAEVIANMPNAYDVEKVVDYTHDIIYNILEKVLEPLPDGSEYTEEAYRLLYLNTRISDAIRNGGKE